MGWPGPNVARAPSGGDSECLHWMLLEPIHGGHCLPDQQTTWFEYSSSEAAHRPATGVAYISAFVCHQNFPATLLLNPLTLKSRCWNLLGTVCHAPSARWPEGPRFLLLQLRKEHASGNARLLSGFPNQHPRSLSFRCCCYYEVSTKSTSCRAETSEVWLADRQHWRHLDLSVKPLL